MTALLAAQGLPPTTKGGHVAPITAVRAQLGVHAKALRSYDRLRVTRNRTDDPSPGATLSGDDVREGIMRAGDIVDVATTVLPQRQSSSVKQSRHTAAQCRPVVQGALARCRGQGIIRSVGGCIGPDRGVERAVHRPSRVHDPTVPESDRRQPRGLPRRVRISRQERSSRPLLVEHVAPWADCSPNGRSGGINTGSIPR